MKVIDQYLEIKLSQNNVNVLNFYSCLSKFLYTSNYLAWPTFHIIESLLKRFTIQICPIFTIYICFHPIMSFYFNLCTLLKDCYNDKLVKEIHKIRKTTKNTNIGNKTKYQLFYISRPFRSMMRKMLIIEIFKYAFYPFAMGNKMMLDFLESGVGLILLFCQSPTNIQ